MSPGLLKPTLLRFNQSDQNVTSKAVHCARDDLFGALAEINNLASSLSLSSATSLTKNDHHFI